MVVASRRLTIVITTLWLLLNAWSATAETSEQIWVDYNPLWQGAGQVELFGDVGYRTEIDNNDVWRLVLRPSVAVPAGKFRLTAGIGNFLTFFDAIDDRWELRPFQGVSTVWPEGRFSMEHYVRLEERFDFNTENWNSVNSLRLRYQLLTTWLLPSMQDDRRWSLFGIIDITPIFPEIGFIKILSLTILVPCFHPRNV